MQIEKKSNKLPNDELSKLSLDLALRLEEADGVKAAQDDCFWNLLVILGDEDGDEHKLEFKIRFELAALVAKLVVTPFVANAVELFEEDELPILYVVVFLYTFILQFKLIYISF